MAEVFKCPACNAPLEFEGKTIQKCVHCGSSVIVPTDTMRQSNAFGSAGSLDFGDLSNITGKALKIAEVQGLIQQGQKIQAIKLFRETFGGGLKEAKDAVDAMERGESVDISGMRVQSAKAQTQFVNFGGENFVNPGAKKSANYDNERKLGCLGPILIPFIILAAIAGLIAYFYFGSVDQAIDKTVVTLKGKEKAEEILKFGGDGNGAGKFKDNRFIAVDGSGKVYSIDYYGGKIQVFDAAGKFLNQWIADAKLLPYDMTASRQGTIYLAGTTGVFAFDGATGKLLNKLEGVDLKGLAIMPDGKIAATLDRGFAIFDADLKKIKEFKTANEAANLDFGFDKIAVDGNNGIYMISDTENYICKFSAEGKFIDRFKVENSPNSIAIDNRGRIFIVDTSEINVYDADGKPLESFETYQTFGSAFDDNGDLFVAARPFVIKYKLNF